MMMEQSVKDRLEALSSITGKPAYDSGIARSSSSRFARRRNGGL